MAAEQLILVDSEDRELGIRDKFRVHVEGSLHRAFSVFVFDSKNRLLLQQRADGKYHSAGLWSNTACGHPRPGESTTIAARRRLAEEMGFDCELSRAFSFLYHTVFDNRMVEHEYDHVFVGRFDGEPLPNSDEVQSWRWMELSDLHREVRNQPDHYTYWLHAALNRAEWKQLEGKIQTDDSF